MTNWEMFLNSGLTGEQYIKLDYKGFDWNKTDLQTITINNHNYYVFSTKTEKGTDIIIRDFENGNQYEGWETGIYITGKDAFDCAYNSSENFKEYVDEN